MTYEIYQETEQERRETLADQKAEEWGLALLELAELVRIWGYDSILAELKKIKPDDFKKRDADRMFRSYYEEF